jgi:hypothetical protein
MILIITISVSSSILLPMLIGWIIDRQYKDHSLRFSPYIISKVESFRRLLILKMLDKIVPSSLHEVS